MKTNSPKQLVACLISFGVVGLSGILLNILMLNNFGVEGVAILNQFLALYFIGSQLTTFGIHQSTLSHSATRRKNVNIIIGAIILSILIGFAFSVITFILVKFAIKPLSSPDFAGNITPLIPVLMCASINKIAIGAFNGMGMLYKFALANAIRMLLLLIGAIAANLWHIEAANITYIFILAEFGLLLFVISTALINASLYKMSKIQVKYWIKKHFAFGKFAVLSGFILDLNSKIDILILSFFVSQHDVGVYSFAAMLGEGFYQLITVLKNYCSKDLAKLIHEKVEGSQMAYGLEYQKFVMLIVLACVLSNVLYFPTMQLIIDDNLFISRGFPIYLIYSLTLTLFSRWLILDNFYILSKQPKQDNIMRMKICGANMICAMTLVPILGNIGAVLGVAAGIAVNGLAVRKAMLSSSTH